MIELIAFLSTYKEAIGAIISILEGIVILINIWKKLRGNVSAQSVSSKFRTVLWVIDPRNVFK